MFKKNYCLVYCNYYFFQNWGITSTRTVNNSSLPISIAKIKTHLAPKGIPEKLPSGPIVEPRPGPTLAKEVAAADNDVIKSS